MGSIFIAITDEKSTMQQFHVTSRAEWFYAEVLHAKLFILLSEQWKSLSCSILSNLLGKFARSEKINRQENPKSIVNNQTFLEEFFGERKKKGMQEKCWDKKPKLSLPSRPQASISCVNVRVYHLVLKFSFPQEETFHTLLYLEGQIGNFPNPTNRGQISQIRIEKWKNKSHECSSRTFD